MNTLCHSARALFFSFSLSLPMLLLCSCHEKKEKDASLAATASIRTDTTALLVMQVRDCARLYTTEFVVRKIVTFSDSPTMRGQILGFDVDMPTRLGDRKIAIPIDVTLKAYIDFADFGPQNVERTDSSIVVTLPDPHVVSTASKIDNKGTRQFIDGLRSRFSDSEVTALARQGEDSIWAHASQLGIEAQAQRSASSQLLPMLLRMGYKEQNVTIRFRKHFTDQDWLKMKEKD